MVMLTNDRELERRVIAYRRKRDLDRFDEVWNGVYVMSPIADDEHHELTTMLGWAFVESGLPKGSRVRAGVNVSDRPGPDWKKNFRVPDVAVFLPGTTARLCGTHWHGGPDFVVEVVSRGDRSRKKLPFYAKVGTREVLLMHRAPWSLELYRREGDAMVLVGRSTVAEPVVLRSDVIPLSFCLTPGAEADRPQLVLERLDGAGGWRI
jgi:Uma2 family endonuclease